MYASLEFCLKKVLTPEPFLWNTPHASAEHTFAIPAIPAIQIVNVEVTLSMTVMKRTNVKSDCKF